MLKPFTGLLVGSGEIVGGNGHSIPAKHCWPSGHSEFKPYQCVVISNKNTNTYSIQKEVVEATHSPPDKADHNQGRRNNSSHTCSEYLMVAFDGECHDILMLHLMIGPMHKEITVQVNWSIDSWKPFWNGYWCSCKENCGCCRQQGTTVGVLIAFAFYSFGYLLCLRVWVLGVGEGGWTVDGGRWTREERREERGDERV